MRDRDTPQSERCDVDETVDADVVFLTGMHRSGTSFLAKRFADGGLCFPGDLLPANEDNPEGYWEARDVVRFNNEILKGAGLSWRHHNPIADDQMGILVRTHVANAADILSELRAHSSGRTLAIKDPRLCRLLPIWTAAAERLGLTARTVATLRAPDAVAQSLFRRNSDPKFKPAAVANPSKAYLLWARYMLDLVAHGADLGLTLIPFDEIASFNLTDLRALPSDIILPGPPLPDLPALTLPKFCEHVLQMLRAGAADRRIPSLKQARQCFDEVTRSAPSDCDRLDGPIVAGTAARFGIAAAAPQPRRLGFVSGVPNSKGHIYRVENRIDSLIGDDWITFRIDPASDDIAACVDACDVILVFRKEMDDWLDRLYREAQSLGVKIIFDIDDLIFDPELMTPEYFRHLETLDREKRSVWVERSKAYLAALSRADAAIFPTRALADHGEKFCSSVFVVPNGLSHARLRIAKKLPRPTNPRVVIGYASGTATHDHDFNVVAPVLADVLQANPDVRLVLQGPLSGDGIDALVTVSDQIERRDLVPFSELPEALQAYDINIAPLEVGNPFCESKSQLKFFEAGLVGVPSIVSATRCFAESVEHGVTGYVARTREDWKQALEHLIRDAGFRVRMGQRAEEQVLKEYSPHSQKRAFKRAIEHALALEATPAAKTARLDEAGFSLIEVLVSLAIASLVSMLIFGSLRQQYQLIDRVQDASAEALDRQARSRLLSNVLRTTTPAWPEAEVEKFVGSAYQMSGVSNEAIFGDSAAMQQYTVRLLQIGGQRSINLETEEGVWEIGTVPGTARFSYYGHDGVWHETWPPQRPAPRTIPEMEQHAALGVLPALIRIDSESEQMVESWVFAMYNTDSPSLRAQDLVGDLNPDF